MELTGKCKEGFEEWYLKGVNNEENYHRHVITSFYSKSESMQYGVYVDFFDIVGVNSSSFSHYEFYKCNLDNTLFHTRPEARTAAIEKANELHNEFLNK